MIEQIVSGGQTGIDRAALDIAIELKISHGGWCPRGRKAEDGIIPRYYQLRETGSDNYSERTKLNIKDSDGTLILISGSVPVTNGTMLTIQEAKFREKPHLVVDLSKEFDVNLLSRWIKENNVKVLNIAGPRESSSPGIYQLGIQFLKNSLSPLVN
ncbi:6187_t:CDS:1 [Ambispora leptoticha]|uniref:6187_t:CDS:1 n=1 Tax=Ambispora leptoticha TaxID=144679 RepID=A0A9N9B1H5_9GLOM|nr:6187_t:CDS:1 [Ambispora leptoticha]